MKVVLGWDMTFSHSWSLRLRGHAAYVALGGLRSAIFNEVSAVRTDLGWRVCWCRFSA
jgi:hypothetical protein